MRATLEPHEIRTAEAVYRSEAHCLAANELYGAGRAPDALLQAARPMTDVFPWLETELRSSSDALNRFTGAVAEVGREVRRGATTRTVRRSVRKVSKARRALIDDAAGPGAATGPFLASVAVALVRTLARQYATALSEEEVGGYHACYALKHVSCRLLSDAGGDRVPELRAEMAALESAFPSSQPPPLLTRPEQVEAITERIAQHAQDELDARPCEETLKDSLVVVDRLLDDVLESYERGVAPLSARLAASLFVRSYDPIRARLSDGHPEIESRVTELLGVEIRRRINDGASPQALRVLVEEARALIRTAAAQTS